MRRPFVVVLFAIATCLWGAPAGTTALPSLYVRLITPLTSYTSMAGSEFRTVVIAPYVVGGRLVIPAGAIVSGRVEQRKGVGLGFVRERATLKLSFDEYELGDGRRYAIEGVVRHIDNARETVNDKGQIRGILAANNPQSFIQGIWHRPRLTHLSRSFIGLTGAGGKIFTEYSMGPIGAAGLFVVRLAMFRLPEPEIQLPAGTDLQVRVNRIPPDAPTSARVEPEPVAPGLAEFLSERPVEVMKSEEEPAEDIINIVFEGSRLDLDRAFHAAGWFQAELLTTRTFARSYRSYTRQIGYPEAPVSKLFYQGAEPEVIYQKSLNTISKRHHIRVWKTELEGRELWLGAATHDIGIKFKKRAMSFTHKIDRRIDLERSKLINDLVFTGCVDQARYLEREDVRAGQLRLGRILTDGRLAIVSLRDCSGETPAQALPLPPPPKSRLARVARRMLLEGRQYALRGNAYYWAYRLVTFRRSADEQERLINED